jgi:hypothetical protein
MEWVIPVITGVAAITTLFLSRPERTIVAWIAVVLIVITAGWQAYTVYQQERTKAEISAHAYKSLAYGTQHFLTVVRDMIFYSTDGWLPSSEEEFFSRKTAEVVCGSLNIDASAPILPERPWRQWIVQSAREYKKTLNEVLQYYAQTLPPELVKNISSVANSTLFFGTIPLMEMQVTDRKLGVRRAPLLCNGAESVIAEDLIKLRALYKDIRQDSKNSQILSGPDLFDMVQSKRWPRHLMGRDRFKD